LIFEIWLNDLSLFMAALRSRCGHYIFVLFLLSSFFLLFSSPNLSGRRLDVYHTWCGLSANLECRSEMYCLRLAENTGCKKLPKNPHLVTIAQLCRAVSSQLRHVSTSAKKLVKICWRVWGTPANFNGFRVLATLHCMA